MPGKGFGDRRVIGVCGRRVRAGVAMAELAPQKVLKPREQARIRRRRGGVDVPRSPV
jgi:hypothetical protein